MKTKTFIVIVMLLLSYGIANAAYTSPGWSYGAELGIARGDNAGDAENFAPLLGAHLQLDLFDFLAVRIGGGYTALHATQSSPDGYSTNTLMADARVVLQPFNQYKYSPYIYAGTGGAKELRHFNEDIIPFFPIGLGVRTTLKEGMALDISGGYNLFNSDILDGRERAENDMNRFTDRKQDGFWGLTVGLVFSSRRAAPVEQAPPVVYIPPTPVVTPEPVKPPVVEKVDLRKQDSDGDGLSDYDEINIYKTDPNNPDTDGDGLTDYQEVMVYKTDPLKKDTDGDGLTDYEEVMIYKTDPLKKDTDGDGLTDYEEVMVYKTNPLVKDTDGGGVDDGQEVRENKNPLDPKDDILDLTTVGKKIALEGIFFDTAKYSILPESATILEQAYIALKANPEVKIIISGHTDSVGSASSNLTLSQNRANSVKEWLVTKGINANRIKTVGKGLTEPRANNNTAEGRALNRRIEFEIE